MLQFQNNLKLLPSNCLFPCLSPLLISHSSQFSLRNSSTSTLYSICSAHKLSVAQASEEPTIAIKSSVDAPPEEGPIELSPSIPPIFSTSDDPTTLQTATSVLLTGAITVFLFRSLRRRAKRAKETRFRSSGAKKSLKEEAVESLKAVSLSPVTAKSPPSPVQALLGGLTAGVIAVILYKFTTTIEASLSRQTLSDNFSVRQITITIRTIVNGLCYLATFVFGINAVGLVLYSGQLAINSVMGESTDQDEAPLSSSNSKSSSTDNSGITGSDEDQSSGNTQ
ncbi:unnamed protein product [Fraxinus pennsylvanica]|uniref:Transmembrane protein n=1 Tax=Fraxinus pennsylvanica TaxID=56036 RepID=A0AAD2A9N1_9LAMI|nr:unnamed protein product [Fraxinus pennsylvanica]